MGRRMRLAGYERVEKKVEKRKDKDVKNGILNMNGLK